ncbi:hypothetical protein T484DRAFT_1925564 [Baffinella frigidus]|nr:hypothetical protein T484DRAFT_1925564 [Cryptophyta sp. CCMP2293]
MKVSLISLVCRAWACAASLLPRGVSSGSEGWFAPRMVQVAVGVAPRAHVYDKYRLYTYMYTLRTQSTRIYWYMYVHILV